MKIVRVSVCGEQTEDGASGGWRERGSGTIPFAADVAKAISDSEIAFVSELEENDGPDAED